MYELHCGNPTLTTTGSVPMTDAKKLEPQHKRVIELIVRDRDAEGWASISALLFPVISQNMPSELVEFEKLEKGGRARLTAQGESVLDAMAWL